MFGYITVRKDDLKIKDYNKYQAYYCGVCQELKDIGGLKSQATLTYDMTFLAVLLTGLYEEPTQREEHYCIVHPAKKHLCLRNEYTRYAAEMNLLLSYYSLLDDWEDEKKHTSLAAAKLLQNPSKRIEETYPRQAKLIQDYLQKIHLCEQENSQDLDLAAGYTGEALAGIYCYKEDVWAPDLAQLGFFLGKFIYLMDAWEDLEKDEKTGNYNPLKYLKDNSAYETTVENLLLMMTAEASRAFEKLPILENVDILRNILYSGIWTKYEMTRASRERGKTDADGRSE